MKEWIVNKQKGKIMGVREFVFNKCQYCGNFVPTDSPPPKQSYDAAQIRAGISMLIPDSCLKNKPGTATSHATNFNGVYCSLVCLLREIYAVVPWDKVFGDIKNDN
jgi:hypothetical protein